MPPKKKKKRTGGFEIVRLIFLLMLGLKLSDAQVSREEDDGPSADRGSHNAAFFALRSCHQVLHGDSGEFFSPDYLCSNPPLWCNWTIQVPPGKRIHLHLEDLGPDDSCQGRRDQIHVDEPESTLSRHGVLQKCWREAKYTSSSNTVHVVLLIEGSPVAPYRGFYGRYQAFGPPLVYNPQETDSGFSEYSPNEPSAVTSEPAYDYYDEPEETISATNDEPDVEHETQADENLNSNSENQLTLDSTDVSFEETDETEPQLQPKPNPRVATAIRRNVDKAEVVNTDNEISQSEDEMLSRLEDELMEQSEDEKPASSKEEKTRTDVLKPQFDHRADTRAHFKYHPQSLHLPGDLLFEVSVEVNFSQDSETSWDITAQSLLLSVKTLIRDQLKSMLVSQSISSKRIKRLNAGVLFILWLQIGQRTSSHHAHGVVHSSLQQLIGSSLGLRGKHGDAAIMSLSTADVNECDTQLVVCDPNAECVNHFGSYSCQCGTGFQDESRSGAGTVCVDMRKTDCVSGPSSEAKAVYILFFLLSVLIMSVLTVSALFYHRHRRGSFFIPAPDPNNNIQHVDSELPPPPPPRIPPVDLQLLRFNALMSRESKT